jgi:DNA-binding transcriptional regulator YiaG
MPPEEITAARHKLGLTIAQFARLLDMAPRTLGAYLAPEAAEIHRPAPARMARLIAAYIAGYRPEDWPGAKRD